MMKPNQLSDQNPILAFYSGRGEDDRGRTFSQILAWNDARLEDVHDYIQWLFPLPERSGANPSAPILDAGTIAAFRADPALQDRLRQALLRMLAFYGLGSEDGKVIRGEQFQQKAENWLSPGNHNHLRLSRILRSLTVLGLKGDAGSLYNCLRSIYEEEMVKARTGILPRTFEFWTRAIQD